MKTKASWGDFYADAGGVDYLLDHIAVHKDFLKEILIREPQTAMEAGCGSAIMSIFLAMTGVKVTACDRDEAVLDQAKRTAERWKSPVTFAKEDILKTGFRDDAFDVVFSQGVLEHLNDEQIRKTAAESLRAAKYFIFSVPGEHYKHQDFGDERLLSQKAWKSILRGIGTLELKPYFELRTKKNLLMKKPLMLMGILTR